MLVCVCLTILSHFYWGTLGYAASEPIAAGVPWLDLLSRALVASRPIGPAYQRPAASRPVPLIRQLQLARLAAYSSQSLRSQRPLAVHVRVHVVNLAKVM